MKKLTCHLTTIVLTLCIIAFSIAAQAQFPDFTRIDTGSIYLSEGSLAHATGILFDIDNDGDLDPVISSMNACDSPVDQLELYRNERNGLYKQRRFLPEYSNAFGVLHPSSMGDIDNDGDIDVVAMNFNLTRIGVFINDGYGNFLSDTSFVVQSSFGSFDAVLLDYNKDGHLDLLFFSSSVKVFYNDGSGRFLDGEILTTINRPEDAWIHSMAWGDADDDGDMDVYCGFTHWIPKNAFFMNTGDSLEQVDENHITLSDTAMTPSVNWVDYDNDGDMDLSVMNEDPDTVNGVMHALYENLGNLEFEKHIVLEEMYRGSFTISDYWADLDNDGDQDLFISLEDGPFPFYSSGYYGEYSPTPYNILYLNEGNGQFTNVLNHTLTLGEGHTAKIFDHDNDGDLDVLTIGNAYDDEGHCHLYINEGNDNSSVSIACVDRFNCASPYGTRVYAKTMIEGEYVLQTRVLTLNDGNFAYTCTPLHFGLGDADIVDTLVIQWPSGHVDEYLNVKANQFYRAFEDEALEIDFRATNYIQYSPSIPDQHLALGETVTIDLKQHYRFMAGDTIPEITGDTLTFSIYGNDYPEIIQATVEGNMLALKRLAEDGFATIQIHASVGFTDRVDQFEVGTAGISILNVYQKLQIHPNPFSGETTFNITLDEPTQVNLVVMDSFGRMVATVVNESLSKGDHYISWNAEGLPSGIYFYRLTTGSQSSTGKMVVVK